MPAVFRAVLPKARDFLSFWERVGRPRYAVHEDAGHVTFMQHDEWVFSDDRDAMMREVLSWDSQGLCFVWCDPTDAERAEWGDELEGAWNVPGLPDFLADAFANLPAREAAPSQEALREALFDTVLSVTECYGFFELDMTDARGYLKDWALDDDKLDRPEVYRAQRYFGVIERVHAEGGARPPRYLVFVGSRLGHVLRSQLEAVGLDVDCLVGMTCVVNGLNEIVLIGSQPIPAVVPTPSS